MKTTPAASTVRNRPRMNPAREPANRRTNFSRTAHVPCSVHIIDDDAPLGAALSAGLEAHGYQTCCFTSADAGWAAARSDHPDLILCDINMPGKNGHRFLGDIRADPELDDCQFVFMTGNPAYAHPRVGMDLGADDFLIKPFTLDELVGCIDARLKRREIRRQNEAALLAQLRESLHRSLPHEFFTPLTGIIGYAELLEQDLDCMSREAVQEAAQSIALSGQRLHRTLRNYLCTLGVVNAEEAAVHPRLSADEVTQALRDGAGAAARRHKRADDLQLDLVAAPLSGSPQDLSLIAEELAENAFSQSSRGTPVEITARSTATELQITVCDHGRGMTARQLRALGAFQQFERKKYEQQGLGLGLFIVRQCLQRLHGRLNLESTPGRGTTCHVRLPLRLAN
jgi:two-component system sensor histidine kinase/response regulator